MLCYFGQKKQVLDLQVGNINTGLFLPTTFEFDVARLYETDVNSPEFKELIVRLYQAVNNVIIATNYKETGLHTLTEFVTGILWYPDPALSSTYSSSALIFRPTFRIVVPCGPLLNNATKSVAHGLTMTTAFRMKYVEAVANKPTLAFSYIPLNYSDSAGNMAWIIIDGTNVNITTVSVTIDWTQYTDIDVILYYTKQ